MREIKFRVWNKTQKVMGTVEKINFVTGYVVNDSFVSESEDEEIILMQYTGLKDKNGKEIYEGDIVENNYIKWVIDWYEGGVYLKQIGKEYNTWWIGGEYEHSEVIGNVYENPELIK